MENREVKKKLQEMLDAVGQIVFTEVTPAQIKRIIDDVLARVSRPSFRGFIPYSWERHPAETDVITQSELYDILVGNLGRFDIFIYNEIVNRLADMGIKVITDIGGHDKMSFRSGILPDIIVLVRDQK
jgi:hypothetical protein